VIFWAFRNESLYQFREETAPVSATDAELAEVRRTGIAFRASPRDGVSAVATPIRDPAGQVVATLAVVDIAQFVPEETDSPVALALLAGAETISRRMVNPLDGGAD
jgi:DNA-binding IclR family transcriptional regulator